MSTPRLCAAIEFPKRLGNWMQTSLARYLAAATSPPSPYYSLTATTVRNLSILAFTLLNGLTGRSVSKQNKEIEDDPEP